MLLPLLHYWLRRLHGPTGRGLYLSGCKAVLPWRWLNWHRGQRERAGQVVSALLVALAKGEPAGLPDPFLFYEQLLRALTPLHPERASAIWAEAQQHFRAQQSLITGSNDQQRFLRADASRQFVMHEPL